MIDESENEVAAVVRDVLTHFPSVVAGYLFGSACRGLRGPLSDIDVAVLVRNTPSRRSREGEMQDALCRALGTDRVDFVSLYDAPASLSYRIIRDGHCVCCNSRRGREAFETETIMRYLDFKPVRDMAFRTSRS